MSLWDKNTSAPASVGSVTTLHQASASSETTGGFTGLEQVELGGRRLSVDEKQIINCRADLNQIVPLKYHWAWDKYLAACANHWMPSEISMAADIAMWGDPNGLTDDERRVLKQALGFFSTSESLVANNLEIGKHTSELQSRGHRVCLLLL